MPIIDSALKYINKRVSVIPLKKDSKAPIIPEWKMYQGRIPTEEEVMAWYKRWPDAGVGVICGEVSGRLAVLDIDDLELAEKIASLGERLPTLTVRTPSAGLHLLVRESVAVSRSGPLVPGVADLKAEGGYVVAPPTPNYKPLNRTEILTVPNAREWATEFLKSFGVVVDSGNGVSEKAYEALAQRDIGEGERDTVLTSYAGKLWKDGWAIERILVALLTINTRFCKPPLPDDQVEKIVASISRYAREDAPVIEDPSGLNPVYPGYLEKPKPRPMLVDGIIPERYVSLIYGDGGHGKSYLAQAIAISVAIGEPIFLRGVRQTNVLYLDWELDQDEFTIRAYRLAVGMGLPTPPKDVLCYMRMEKPLSMVLPALKTFIDAKKIGFVVIDSLGMAGVRDINSPANAIEFFEKLRSLNTTILAVDHQSKLQKDQAYSQQTPIGTVYKFNLSRSVIQMQKVNWKEGQLDVKLEHKKNTFGSLSRDTNFSILFDGDKIVFLPYTEVAAVS